MNGVVSAPHAHAARPVGRVMALVMLALAPATAAGFWRFGYPAIYLWCVTVLACVFAEAVCVRLADRPARPVLADGSAVLTGWLLALSLPPWAPWWIAAAGGAFAIVVVKQAFGGLGQNPFNPAMVAYCAMIVAFPSLMSQWPPAGQLDFQTQLDLVLGGAREIDAITGATALDAMRTGLRASGASVDAVLLQPGAFGAFGGRGWEWLPLGYAAGGLYLFARRIITWHMPVAFLAALALISGVFWLANPAQFAPPWFHLASGGAMLAAFFIVTDPVSGATTPRGKLIFAAGIALIAYLIRVFGAFPEGIAFAVLLMNICVPLIDMKTQPPVFGHREGRLP